MDRESNGPVSPLGWKCPTLPGRSVGSPDRQWNECIGIGESENHGRGSQTALRVEGFAERVEGCRTPGNSE